MQQQKAGAPVCRHRSPLAVCEGIVHARGAAALTQNLVKWQPSVVRTILSLQFESSCQASATLPEQCDGAASIALGGATVHGRPRRLFAIFENYLANGSPGKSAAKPVVIYAKNYALFVSAGSHQSQRPSDKRCGSSHWGPGDVDRYTLSVKSLFFFYFF